MGAARGLNKAGKISNNLLDQADKTIAQTKQIINKIKGDHAQIDTPRVKDQKSLAPQKLAQTGQDIQGGQSGIGKNTPDLPENSPPPSTTNVGRQSARRDELRSTLAKSLVNLSQEQRDAAVEKMLADESSPLRQQARKEVSRGPFESLKSFTSGLFSGDDDGSDEFSYAATGQQGPATHLVRRTIEKQENPGERYKGVKGVSFDPESGRFDAYYRVAPDKSSYQVVENPSQERYTEGKKAGELKYGPVGIQRRAFFTDDVGVGRNLEYDALDTTQRVSGSDPRSDYMISEDDLAGKSFMKSFVERMKGGGLRKASDEEIEGLRASEPWWER
jgi:hypothetical protein